MDSRRTARRARLWLWLGVPCVLAGLCGATLYRYYLVDEPPTSDSDLRVNLQPVLPQENGYYTLTLSDEDLWWPEDSSADGGKKPQEPSPSEMADLMVNGEAWDEALAREMVRRNQKAIDELDACLKRPEFEFPEPHRNITGILRRACAILAIRAQARLKAGDTSGAIRDGLQPFEFGRRLLQRSHTNLEAMVGAEYLRYGVRVLRCTLSGGRLDANQLRDLAKLLEPLTTNDALWTDWLGRYCVSLADDIDAWVEGEASELGYMLSRGDSAPPWLQRRLLLPNATRAILVSEARRQIDRVRQRRSVSDLPGLDDPARYALHGWLRVRNEVGREMSAYLGVALRKGSECCEQSRLQLTLLHLAIAIRRFELERGRLPVDLAELVPGQLGRIPTDIQDGQALRYSAARRAVHSIGRDHIDHEGSKEGFSDDENVEF